MRQLSSNELQLEKVTGANRSSFGASLGNQLVNCPPLPPAKLQAWLFPRNIIRVRMTKKETARDSNPFQWRGQGSGQGGELGGENGGGQGWRRSRTRRWTERWTRRWTMTKKEDHDADSRRSQSTAIHQFFLPTIIGMDPGTRHVSNFECTNDIDSKSR